jgi:hypothetical protein
VASAALPPLPALAESKYGKEYEKCLSECIYEEEKITKGIAQVEVVSKADAMNTCKVKCKDLKKKVQK